MVSLSRLRRLVVVIMGVTLLGATLINQHCSSNTRHIFTHPFFNYTLEPEDPEQSCQLPRIHPFDQSTWKYFPPPKSIVCKSRQPESLLRFDGTGWIRFDQDVVANYPGLTCSYKAVVRPDGDDLQVEYSEEKLLPFEGLQVLHDFVYVKCAQKSLLSFERPVYEGFLVQAGDLEPSGKFSKFPVKGKSSKLSTKGKSSMLSSSASRKRYNVLLFGVDSLSRLAFIRLLPKTYSYLTNTLKAHIFRGMNKVADNTFPNLVALLTGDDPYAGRLPLPPSVPHYDDWPLLWKNYSDEGYQTLFAEDLPDFNMFNYLTTGFENPPTPYYLRPFWLAVKSSPALKSSSHLCLGGRPRHQVQIDYLQDFVSKRKPYFAFSFLAEISHDYLSRTASADSDFEAFLEWLESRGELSDTVLVFFSDHGHRFDAIRETPVGRIEERMPFFSLVLPRGLKSSRISSNTGRLITPYDVHATLTDLVRNQHAPNKLGKVRTRFGRSLFGPVPANRTCDEAGIPAHYCVCSLKIDASAETLDSESQTYAGRAIVDNVNKLLTDDCVQLELSEVKSAVRSAQGGWIVVVRVLPSNALFEAEVQKTNRPKRFAVRGEVSRINMYKGQSECTDNAILRKYCYCRYLSNAN